MFSSKLDVIRLRELRYSRMLKHQTHRSWTIRVPQSYELGPTFPVIDKFVEPPVQMLPCASQNASIYGLRHRFSYNAFDLCRPKPPHLVHLSGLGVKKKRPLWIRHYYDKGDCRFDEGS